MVGARKEIIKRATGKKAPKEVAKKTKIAKAIPKVKKVERARAPAPAIPFMPEVTKVVEVKRPKIVSTGIPGLDEMLAGGFEEKSIVLVNGDPGAGKTIFGLQFLHSAAQRGEPGLYITFGEPREILYPRVLAMAMDFAELERKKLFFAIEYQPHEVAKIMAEEGGTIYDVVMAYGVKRVVIDPITPYLLQYESLYDARLALVRLFSIVRRWGTTTLLLNEASPALRHPSTTIAEFLADGVINLIHARTADGIQIRGVEVWKMCGVAHSAVSRPFEFTKKGIVVYPRERLFAKP